MKRITEDFDELEKGGEEGKESKAADCFIRITGYRETENISFP
jgi:hypothetical protein